MLTILPNEPENPLLTLCDGQLQVNVYFEPPEEDFEDNVSFSLAETCPPEFKLLSADEVSFTMTSAQARLLAQALVAAADQNDRWLGRFGKGRDAR